YEPIGDSQYSFKGFVDGIISVKHKKKDIIWIIDWKSANARGWTSEKRRDFTVQAQLALYKFYLMQKLTLDAKEVKCSFILLKKGAKPGKICERIDVSAGPKTLEKSQKFISNAISGMNSKIILKNKLSCKFCQFKNTKHCPGSGDF
ncbi:hypothetical protein EBU94_07760, partial [bacterium]|nr:hypothetical protein [bacterium]